MFRSLFGKKKRRPSAEDSSTLTESIRDARPGDVLTVTGLELDYEDAYFIVEEMNRYESSAGSWTELLGVDGDKRLWLNWSDEGGLFVTAMPDGKPAGIEQAGLTRDELVRIDEAQSVDTSITYEGERYYFRHSGEALYFRGNERREEAFYVWDFTSEDGDKVLSIAKWEGMPFQVFASDVVPPESVTVYKQ